MRKMLLGVAIMLVLSVCLAGCGLTDDFKGVQERAEEFMVALKGGNYEAAFDLFAMDLRQEIGSANNLRAMAEANGVLPETWKFTNTNISTEGGKTIGTVEGTVTYRDGGTGELEIYMLKVEAATTAWPIISFNLTR